MADEKEKDATQDLEDEELEGSVEDTDDEENDQAPGEALYEALLDEGLIKGEWEKLTPSVQKKWNEVALNFEA